MSSLVCLNVFHVTYDLALRIFGFPSIHAGMFICGGLLNIQDPMNDPYIYSMIG